MSLNGARVPSMDAQQLKPTYVGKRATAGMEHPPLIHEVEKAWLYVRSRGCMKAMAAQATTYGAMLRMLTGLGTSLCSMYGANEPMGGRGAGTTYGANETLKEWGGRTYRARQGYCGTPYAGRTSIEAGVLLEVEHYHFVLGEKV